MLLVTLSGLLLRSHRVRAPAFLAKHGGDALWAWLVFLLLGFLAPGARTRSLIAGAWLFSWTIEFSQLYHAPWIDALRKTIPGALVLGSAFNAPDLLSYLAGIFFGAFVEPRLTRHPAKEP